MNKDILNGFSLHTVKGIAIGLGAAIIAMMVLSFISSIVIYNTSLMDNSLLAFAIVIIAISAFGGGFLAARLNGSRGLITGLICALFLFVILLLFRSSNGISIPIQLLCCCLPGMAGGFLGIK